MKFKSSTKTIKSIILILLSLIGVIILLLIPALVNKIMFINPPRLLIPKEGISENDVWIGFIATFYGAILGGAISGFLTLLGVKITVKESSKGLNRTIKEQQLIREEELKLQTTKERLFQLYHPVDVLYHDFFYKYGAHLFTHLDKEEQVNLISLLSQNVIYADSKLKSKIFDLREHFYEFEKLDSIFDIEELKEIVNKLYYDIRDIINEDVPKLRAQLKLPEIDFLYDDNKEG